MFRQIDNFQWRDGQSIYDRWPRGRIIQDNNVIKNYLNFPVTLVFTNFNQKITVQNNDGWFGIGIINNSKYINILPFEGTSFNIINSDFNKYKTSSQKRRDECMFDLPKMLLGQSISLMIKDNVLHFIINDIHYPLWSLEQYGDIEWDMFITMNKCEIEI
jgi:hypothetical protein